MTVKQLWARYRRKRTIDHRNALVLNYLPLADFHTSKVQIKVAAFASKNELFGAACLGLIQAVESFDSTRRNIEFEGFSGLRIRGAILDWLRETDMQSRSVRDFEKKKREAEKILANDGNYDIIDVAKKLNISYKEYEHLNRSLLLGKEMHFSALWEESGTLWDAEDKKTLAPECITNRKFLRELINREVKYPESEVLILYYFEGLRIREIAKRLNFHESSIGNMRERAIIRIRRSLQKRTLWRENLFSA